MSKEILTDQEWDRLHPAKQHGRHGRVYSAFRIILMVELIWLIVERYWFGVALIGTMIAAMTFELYLDRKIARLERELKERR